MNFRDYFTHYSKLGKLIGLILGFLMAGPFGAFIGLFVGNFFDKGLSQHFSKPHESYRDEPKDTVKLYFLKATFASIGYIGKAQGRITEALIQNVKQLMKELELNSAEQGLVQEFFRAGKETTQISTYLFDFRGIAQQYPQLLKLCAEFIYRGGKTEGLTHQKIARINEVFHLLGLAPLNIQQRFYHDFFHEHQYQDTSSYSHNTYQQKQHGTYKGSVDEAYAVLQVSPTAPEAEVKKKYRRLMSQYHPDKLIAKKASQAAIKTANEKTQTISRAYEQICKHLS